MDYGEGYLSNATVSAVFISVINIINVCINYNFNPFVYTFFKLQKMPITTSLGPKGCPVIDDLTTKTQNLQLLFLQL